MERWWSTKYKLPSSHKLFQESIYFDLLVEYYQDYYEANPLESYRNDDGTIQFKDTGDALIDSWEQTLADGNTPNIMDDAFSPEQQRAIIERLERARGQNPLHKMYGNT